MWDRWQRGELLKAIGRAFGKPSSSIYFQVAPHGGIRPAPTASFAAGIDAFGARGDIPRHCGGSIDTIDGQVAGPLAVDGKPRNQAAMAAMIDTERRLADENAWVASSSSETLQVGEQSAATTGSGEEAQIELVARADSRLVEESVS